MAPELDGTGRSGCVSVSVRVSGCVLESAVGIAMVVSPSLCVCEVELSLSSVCGMRSGPLWLCLCLCPACVSLRSGPLWLCLCLCRV